MNIKRREFVRLATAGLSLPWLSGVTRAQASEGAPPKRVLIVLEPYGRYGSQTSSPLTNDPPWITSIKGDYALSKEHLGWILNPLKSHIQNLSVLSNVHMRSRQVLGGGISHPQVDSYALTCSRVSGNIRGNNTSANPSINNLIGDELNARAKMKTAFNSMSVGGHLNRVNYDSRGRKAGALGSPKALYNAGFGNNAADTGDISGILSQQVVVDEVRKQINRIAPELVQANAATLLDGYRSSIDRIANELKVRADGLCKDRVPSKILTSADSAAGLAQMFDGIYDLFSCGITNSILYGWTGTGKQPYIINKGLFRSQDINRNLGNRKHHFMSHLRTENAGAAQGLVMRRQMIEIAKLAERLAVTPELDGSGSMMMDNTVICYTQSMTGNVHNTTRPYYRIFLAGSNTNVVRGMHLDCDGHSDNEIFTTLAQGVNIPITRFGGYQGKKYKGSKLNRGPISKALIQTLG